jgi:hypothetical protein
MDVDLTATQLAAANSINIHVMKLSTSPLSTDIPHDDKISDQQDFAASSRLLTILDEKFEDKTWNQHQEGFVFHQIVADSVDHARYKTFLSNRAYMFSMEDNSRIRSNSHTCKYDSHIDNHPEPWCRNKGSEEL